MSSIGTVMLIYGLLTLFMVYMLVFIFTFREIKLKVLAKTKLKRGFGIVEIIKKNGMLIQKVVNYSVDDFTFGKNTYSLKTALKERTNYMKYLWGNVPVVCFIEGDPEPLPIKKKVSQDFDLEYYNKTVELAYLTGATEKYGKTIEQLKKYMVIVLVCSAISALAVVVTFPYLPQILQGLQAAKPHMTNFGPKLIKWLK